MYMSKGKRGGKCQDQNIFHSHSAFNRGFAWWRHVSKIMPTYVCYQRTGGWLVSQARP